jgi:ribonuclease R
MEVEREIVDLHRALLMQSHLGRVYEGTVTGMVGTGVFVSVDQPFVDVLVRMESLGPDRYELDDEKLRVIGARSGDRIAIGDTMRVQIEDVSILRRTVYGKRMAPSEQPDEAEGPVRAKRKVRRTGVTEKGKQKAKGFLGRTLQKAKAKGSGGRKAKKR